MEFFGARTEKSLEVCLSEVEQSDIYIGILGMKYGSIDEDTGKSYTHLEYKKATELELPRLQPSDNYIIGILPISHFTFNSKTRNVVYDSSVMIRSI